MGSSLMVDKQEISKMEVSIMGGCLPLSRLRSSCPTRATEMPDVSGLLIDVGVKDVEWW